MTNNIKVIAFDADDTLWENESFFQDAQVEFGKILKDWIAPEDVVDEHYKTELNNIPVWGYGIKGFTLSLIESAIRISQNKVTPQQIKQIIDLGKSMTQHPINLLPEVEETLETLAPHYRLIVATKGDLLDQERKLKRSGIDQYFHHVEVMSDKTPDAYQKLIQHLDITPEEFVMIGNALRSDIVPVLEIGANAIHVPYHIDWVHERVESFEGDPKRFKTCESLRDCWSFFL